MQKSTGGRVEKFMMSRGKRSAHSRPFIVLATEPCGSNARFIRFLFRGLSARQSRPGFQSVPWGINSRGKTRFRVAMGERLLRNREKRERKRESFHSLDTLLLDEDILISLYDTEFHSPSFGRPSTHFKSKEGIERPRSCKLRIIIIGENYTVLCFVAN